MRVGIAGECCMTDYELYEKLVDWTKLEEVLSEDN